MSKTFGAALAFLTFLVAASWLPAQDTPRETVKLRLIGANPSARSMPLTNLPEPSYFFLRDKPDATPEQIQKLARCWYHDVYPGIDLLCYDNGYDMEYVFILAPGADPSLIRMAYEGPKNFSITHTGSILMRIQGGEVVQGPPVAFVKTDASTRATDGRYDIGFGGVVSVHLPKVRAAQAAQFNGSAFSLIPRGGQPGGPMYNYYFSKFETTQGQYLRFLNDAEANANNRRGSSMIFDSNGNVWIHPRKKRDRDELFTVANSRLTYDPRKPAGARYDHRRAADKSAPFASHPASGISWYGAVKYCNWLTVESGRTPSECAYQEGTNAIGWRPVTATNWANGRFDDAERELWLSAKGFRLPMVNASTPTLTTNSYNEFYKAAAWYGFTNRVYGFGRDLFDGTDANCRETIGVKAPGPLPVGFFNGEGLLGRIRTRANANLYGLFDLTGNANEWVNDFATRGDPSSRLLCGGSWDRSLRPLSTAAAVPPSSTDTGSGFRTATTYMPSEAVVIHILYSFFMEPQAGTLATQKVGGVIGTEEPPTEESGAAGEKLEVTPNEMTPSGLTYQTPPEIEEIVPEGGSPGGGGPGESPPPPVGVGTNTLIVESQSPNAGVPITITPSDVTGGGDGVTPSITRYYLQDTVVHLTAPATADGNSFVRWLRNGVAYSVDLSIDITMSSDITMTAVYVGQRTLTVESQNPDSDVAITVTPTDRNGDGDGNTTFSRTYNDGASVTLTAPTTAGGNIFIQWLRNGVLYDTDPTISVIMDSDITMTAVYETPTYRILTVRSSNPGTGVTISVPNDNNGDGAGSTTFTRIYDVGTTIVLDAPLFAGGNRFKEWQLNGVFFSSARVTLLTMNNNYTMMAIYVYDPIIIPDPDVSGGGI